MKVSLRVRLPSSVCVYSSLFPLHSLRPGSVSEGESLFPLHSSRPGSVSESASPSELQSASFFYLHGIATARRS
ncbi:hypothetical protein K1719_043722 [Acacia pycnantha]|nr:hypothetical protein K1719_043722 [Acacia pycnantha]